MVFSPPEMKLAKLTSVYIVYGRNRYFCFGPIPKLKLAHTFGPIVPYMVPKPDFKGKKKSSCQFFLSSKKTKLVAECYKFLDFFSSLPLKINITARRWKTTIFTFFEKKVSVLQRKVLATVPIPKLDLGFGSRC